MLCSTDQLVGRGASGFTLVEMLVVVSLIALASAMAGTSMLDQLRAQQLASAIQNSRMMATAIEQIRPQLIADHGAAFGSYSGTLADFMGDLEGANSALAIELRVFFSDTDTVLGHSAGNVYSVTLTPASTFVSITLDSESYAGFNFYSTAKDVSAPNVSWTVPHRTVHPSTAGFRFINEINKR